MPMAPMPGSLIQLISAIKVVKFTITPELYDTKSYYKLIVSIIKCEKLWSQRFNIKAHKFLINRIG